RLSCSKSMRVHQGVGGNHRHGYSAQFSSSRSRWSLWVSLGCEVSGEGQSDRNHEHAVPVRLSLAYMGTYLAYSCGGGTEYASDELAVVLLGITARLSETDERTNSSHLFVQESYDEADDSSSL